MNLKLSFNITKDENFESLETIPLNVHCLNGENGGCPSKNTCAKSTILEKGLKYIQSYAPRSACICKYLYFLTFFIPLILFYNPLKHQETRGFQTFHGVCIPFGSQSF